MKNGAIIKRGVVVASAAVLAAAYGCERPNPNRLVDDQSAVFSYCETPSTGSSPTTTGGTNGAPNDPRFARTILDFYHYTFKMGGASSVPTEPNRDTAPTFAARVVYEGKDWREILTATGNTPAGPTCPTYSDAGGFKDGN